MRIKIISAPNQKAFGGDLQSHGATWDNGITYIGNGGSHEANPYEGVQIGVDPQGVPNLVEEGEVLWNDFVFSKRINMPKKDRELFKLGGNKPLSYADAALRLSKESEERPNDPISKAGLDRMLTSLSESQEALKAQREQRQARLQFNQMSPEEQMGIMQMAQQQQMVPQTPQDPSMAMLDNPYGNMSAFGGPVNKFPNGGTAERKEQRLRSKYPLSWFQTRADNLGFELSQDFINKFATRSSTERLAALNKLYKDTLEERARKSHEESQKKAWINENIGKDKTYRRSADGKHIYKAKFDDKGDFLRDDKGAIIYDTDTDLALNDAYLKDADLAKGFKFDPSTVSEITYDPEVNDSGLSYLRYAPALGGAIGLMSDIFTRPDYSRAQEIKDAASYRVPSVSYTPIGNYLRYNPMDINYAQNRLNQEAAAARRAIQNTAGTRGAAMSGILAADYNAQQASGDLFQKALEYNNAQRQRVEDFNRGTNMFNSQQDIAAQRANQAATQQALRDRYQGIYTGNALADQIDARRAASMSTNMTNMFNSLGEIGNDAYNRSIIDALVQRGVLQDFYGKKEKAAGGMLTRPKRRKGGRK